MIENKDSFRKLSNFFFLIYSHVIICAICAIINCKERLIIIIIYFSLKLCYDT